MPPEVFQPAHSLHMPMGMYLRSLLHFIAPTSLFLDWSRGQTSDGSGCYMVEGCAGPSCCRAHSVEVKAKNQLADLIHYDLCYVLLLVM
jgi:hypothetical protein